MHQRTAVVLVVAVLVLVPSVALASVTFGSTATVPGYSSTSMTSEPVGVEINPNTDLEGVQITIAPGITSSDTKATHAYVFDSSDTLLHRQPINGSSGTTEILETELSQGSTYAVAVGREDGSSYTSPMGDSNFPYTSSDVDITGIYGVLSSTPYIESVTAITQIDRATFSIYNETNPDERVGYPVGATVLFEGADGSIYEFTTENGSVPMDGLPEQSYSVTVETESPSGSPEYSTRSLHIDSPSSDQEIYLLNSAETADRIVFTLDDKTGDFVPVRETVLSIQAPLATSGGTGYRTITSSTFGASGEIVVDLQSDQSYRLRIENPGGDMRVLGAYRTTGDDAATLTVGEVSFGGASATNTAFHATITEVQGQRSLRILYYDPARQTDDLRIEAVNRSDASDVLRQNTSEQGPFGRYVETIPISSSADSIAYDVRFHANRGGGYDDAGGTEFVGDVPDLATRFAVDPGVLSAMSYLTIFGVLGITAIAYPQYCGIPTVVVAIGLVTFGAVSINPLLLSGAGVTALLVAVGGGR